MKTIKTKSGTLDVDIVELIGPMYIEGRGEILGYRGYRKNYSRDYVYGEVKVKDIVEIIDE